MGDNGQIKGKKTWVRDLDFKKIKVIRCFTNAPNFQMVVNYVYVVLKKLVHGKRTLLKSEGKVDLCRKGSKYAFKIVALLSSTSRSPPSHL